jgi:polysaccharide pyruvyl transferase WcaK-like protein
MKVLLYVPVPLKLAFKEIERSLLQSVKSGIRVRLENEWSAATGTFAISEFHHRTQINTNRGDVAIGVACGEVFGQLLAGADITVEGWDELNPNRIEQINRDYDLFVVAGGGYIFLDHQGRLNDRSRDLQLFEGLRIPLAIYGIGLNRLMHEEVFPLSDLAKYPQATLEYLRKLAAKAIAIGVRDGASQLLFKVTTGVEPWLTGDPALFLDRQAAPDGGAVTARQGHVAINTAAHGWRACVILKKVMPAMEAVFKHLAQAGNRLTYMEHDQIEGAVIHYLNRRRLAFTPFRGDTQGMVRKYREQDFVVNQMLHASILAFCADTPSINVAYDTKSLEFFDLFGLSEFCIPWRDASERRILDTASRLSASRADVVAKIRARKLALWAQNEAYFAALRASLAASAN